MACPKGSPGRPRKSPQRLIADRRYSYPSCRGLLRRRGIRQLSWRSSSWLVSTLCSSSSLSTAGVATMTSKGRRAVAKTCHKELAELYEERLRKTGLTVSIEPGR